MHDVDCGLYSYCHLCEDKVDRFYCDWQAVGHENGRAEGGWLCSNRYRITKRCETDNNAVLCLIDQSGTCLSLCGLTLTSSTRDQVT